MKSGKFEFCDACKSLILLGQCSNKRCPDKVAAAMLRASSSLKLAIEQIAKLSPDSKQAKAMIDEVALSLQISRKEAIEVIANQFPNNDEWTIKAGVKTSSEEL